MIACTRPPIILYLFYDLNSSFNTTYYKGEMKIVKCDDSHTIHVVRIRNKLIYTNPPLPLFFNDMYHVWSIWRTRIEQWIDFGSSAFGILGGRKQSSCSFVWRVPMWDEISLSGFLSNLWPLKPYLLTLKAPLYVDELWWFVSPRLIT